MFLVHFYTITKHPRPPLLFPVAVFYWYRHSLRNFIRPIIKHASSTGSDCLSGVFASVGRLRWDGKQLDIQFVADLKKGLPMVRAVHKRFNCNRRSMFCIRLLFVCSKTHAKAHEHSNPNPWCVCKCPHANQSLPELWNSIPAPLSYTRLSMQQVDFIGLGVRDIYQRQHENFRNLGTNSILWTLYPEHRDQEPCLDGRSKRDEKHLIMHYRDTGKMLPSLEMITIDY